MHGPSAKHGLSMVTLTASITSKHHQHKIAEKPEEERNSIT